MIKAVCEVLRMFFFHETLFINFMLLVLVADCFMMGFDSYEGHYGVNIFIPRGPETTPDHTETLQTDSTPGIN